MSGICDTARMLPWWLARLVWIAWNLIPFPAVPAVSCADLRQFPPLELAQARRTLLLEHLSVIKVRRAVEPHREAALWEAQVQVVYSERAWGSLCVARTVQEAMPGPDRDQELRERLNDLRRLLGYKAYYAGEMPAVPCWWMPRVE